MTSRIGLILRPKNTFQYCTMVWLTLKAAKEARREAVEKIWTF